MITTLEFTPSRVRNIFICMDVAFCASSRITNASARVRPRMNASGAISMTRVSSAFCIRSIRHHLVERIVQRPQVGIDLCLHVARQEAERLPGLDGRSREHDSSHALPHERVHRRGHGEIGLAGTGRSDPDHDVLLGDLLQVLRLARRLGLHDGTHAGQGDARCRGHTAILRRQAGLGRVLDPQFGQPQHVVGRERQPLPRHVHHALPNRDGP